MSAASAPSHITLGPYELRVQKREREQMSDKRALARVNIEAGCLELRSDLQGERLATAFFECLVRLSHFSKGCQDGCVEEAYTHSFATGLAEFAQRNRQAWAWFNSLLSAHLAPLGQYDRVALGLLARPPAMPKRVLVAGRSVSLRSINRAQSVRLVLGR
jgi:hypothetical protein